MRGSGKGEGEEGEGEGTHSEEKELFTQPWMGVTTSLWWRPFPNASFTRGFL